MTTINLPDEVAQGFVELLGIQHKRGVRIQARIGNKRTGPLVDGNVAHFREVAGAFAMFGMRAGDDNFAIGNYGGVDYIGTGKAFMEVGAQLGDIAGKLENAYLTGTELSPNLRQQEMTI